MFYHQLRNELWKLFGKKRTYIGFGMCFLVQAAILLGLRFAHGPRQEMTRRLTMLGYSPDDFITNLTMAVSILVPVAVILMPLYVTLVGGDLLAKEAEDGSLRMILSRPISRLRIALIKWLAGAIFSVLLVLVLGSFGVAFASLLFPSGGMLALMPMENIFSLFSHAEGWQRYAGALVAVIGEAVTMMGLAWMFSCCNVKPAAATVMALSIMLTSKIMQEIPYFHDWRAWFLTYHLNYWVKFFQPAIPWPEMASSFCILCAFNLTFFIIGCTAFQMRDIKS